jgi:hypothetical protein
VRLGSNNWYQSEVREMSTPPTTPDSNKGSSGGAPCSGVVERVAAGTLEFPTLAKGNYHEWALVMKVNLEALGLWNAVESGSVERREDRMALAAILCAVPAEMKLTIAEKSSAKEPWMAVRIMRLGDERVHEANAQKLLGVFENVKFHDGEMIDEFAMRLNTLASELRALGKKVDEVRLVKKMLHIVPKQYRQIAMSIVTLLDLNTLSLEGLVGRLHAAEVGGDEEEEAQGMARLLLMEEQWEARRHQHSGKGHAGNGDGGSRGGGSHNNDDDDDGGSSTSLRASRHRRSSGKGRCFNCGVRGHFSMECTKPRKEEALLADADDEPTLL